MSLTGEPDGEPMRYPVPISDMTVGLYALIGILAALYERERTGRGQAIDAGILEAQMALADQPGRQLLRHRQESGRAGQPPPDHHALPALPDRRRLDHHRGRHRSHLGPAVRRARHPGRGTRRPALRHQPGAQSQPGRGPGAAERTSEDGANAYWLAKLREADIPSGPIYLLDQALADPQVLARDFIVTWITRSPGWCARSVFRRTCARVRSAIACPRRPGPAHRRDPCRLGVWRRRDRLVA